jgi:hypothetical protein
LLREALVSMESLVEWAAPPESPPKRTRKR